MGVIMLSMSGGRQTWFAVKLRAALDQNGISTREAARRWRPESPEVGRRSLIRYLAGEVTPRPAARAEIARALGIDRSEIEPDDEEESSLALTLLSIVRRVVREECARINFFPEPRA